MAAWTISRFAAITNAVEATCRKRRMASKTSMTVGSRHRSRSSMRTITALTSPRLSIRSSNSSRNSDTDSTTIDGLASADRVCWTLSLNSVNTGN